MSQGLTEIVFSEKYLLLLFSSHQNTQINAFLGYTEVRVTALGLNSSVSLVCMLPWEFGPRTLEDCLAAAGCAYISRMFRMSVTSRAVPSLVCSSGVFSLWTHASYAILKILCHIKPVVADFLRPAVRKALWCWKSP